MISRSSRHARRASSGCRSAIGRPPCVRQVSVWSDAFAPLRQRRAHLRVVQVMAHGQERHGRVERVRRRDQQRVEIGEQVQARCRSRSRAHRAAASASRRPAPRSPFRAADRAASTPSAASPAARRRPGRSSAPDPASSSVGVEPAVFVVLARRAPPASRPRRAAAGRGCGRAPAPGPCPRRSGAAERQILDLFEVHARDLDLDGAREPARARRPDRWRRRRGAPAARARDPSSTATTCRPLEGTPFSSGAPEFRPGADRRRRKSAGKKTARSCVGFRAMRVCPRRRRRRNPSRRRVWPIRPAGVCGPRAPRQRNVPR